jgi:uncharacterized protein YndB with AHSA1/START domain
VTAEIRNDVIVATEHIKAPPEVVFPYFTDPALIVTWIGDRAELDPHPRQRRAAARRFDRRGRADP